MFMFPQIMQLTLLRSIVGNELITTMLPVSGSTPAIKPKPRQGQTGGFGKWSSAFS